MSIEEVDRAVADASARLTTAISRRRFLNRTVTVSGIAAAWMAGIRPVLAHHNETVAPDCGGEYTSFEESCARGCGPSSHCGQDGLTACCGGDFGTHCSQNGCTQRTGECPGANQCWTWTAAACCTQGGQTCTKKWICCDCWTPSSQPCHCSYITCVQPCFV